MNNCNDFCLLASESEMAEPTGVNKIIDLDCLLGCLNMKYIFLLY